MTDQPDQSLGFCDFCGAKRIVAGQSHCGSCGQKLSQLSEVALGPVPAVAAAATQVATEVQAVPEVPVAPTLPVAPSIPEQPLAQPEVLPPPLVPNPPPAWATTAPGDAAATLPPAPYPPPLPAHAADYSRPGGYGSVPGHPAGSGYAPTPAGRNSKPVFVGLGVIGLVVVIIAGAMLLSSAGGSHATSAPLTTNGSQSSAPSASPCVVATTTLTLSATDTPASDVYSLQAQTKASVPGVQLTISCEHGPSTYTGSRFTALQGMTLVLSVAEQRTYSTSGHVYRINGTVSWSTTDMTTIADYDLTVTGGSLGSSAQRCTKASGCSTGTTSGGARTSVPTLAPTAVPTPTPTAVPVAGKIVFTPSKLTCDSPVAFVYVVTLPSSVTTTESITESLDGKVVNTYQVTADFWDHHADGSWSLTSTVTAAQMSTMCKAGGLDPTGLAMLTPGTHTLTETDAGGNILATGSYTVS
ncbi:MAG: hypothetical protein ABSG37_12870 [Candidatus Limnocylindrales bacterium]